MSSSSGEVKLFQLPKRVDKYILESHIGSGTYGVVYKARHVDARPTDLPKAYAVKCIERSRLTKEAEDNMVKEISILLEISHRHIVKLEDFSKDASYVYMIMEYCSGGDLHKYIHTKNGLPEDVARHFFRQIASAIEYLNERNIAHLDLKPQNILVAPSSSGGLPQLKLADFGFANKVQGSEKMASIRGSPLYMAPEILKARSYDRSVDLWSLGVILYEALFGQAPFLSDSYEELIAKIVSDDPIKIPDAPSVSIECRDLLKRLLLRDPHLRMSFAEFFHHPFVDLEHYPSAKSLGKAQQYAKEAIEYDTSGKLQSALHRYCDAVQHLVLAIAYEADPAVKGGLRKRADSYIQRAEALKLLLGTHIEDRSKIAPSPLVRGRKVADLFREYRGGPAGYSDLVLDGLSHCARGETADRKGRFEDALGHYQTGLELFIRALDAGQGGAAGEEMQNALRHEMQKYLGRAEEIKEGIALVRIAGRPEAANDPKKCVVM